MPGKAKVAVLFLAHGQWAFLFGAGGQGRVWQLSLEGVCHNLWALIIAYTVLAVPYYDHSTTSPPKKKETIFVFEAPTLYR